MRSPRSREGVVRSGPFDDDVLSQVSTNSSTVATTASLASRIAGLAIDLEDATAKEQELGTFPEEEEEEEVIEVSEEEVLRVLDAQEDPFQVRVTTRGLWKFRCLGLFAFVPSSCEQSSSVEENEYYTDGGIQAAWIFDSG